MKYYTEDHEWVELCGDEALVGISEYAADQLGDITFVALPEEDDDFNVGDKLAEVESVKATSDIFSPITGTVCEVNDALSDEPGLLNESPEDKDWICKLTDLADPTEINDLMTEEAYFKYLETLKN